LAGVTRMRGGHRRAEFLALAAALSIALLPVRPVALPALAASFDPLLARAPYLTDLTQTSVQVNWATTTQGHGTLRWGPPGACTQNVVTVGIFTRINVAPTGYFLYDYMDSLTISGLSPRSTYCYRIYSSTGVDLLSSANPSPTFTTLDPVSTSSQASLTFAVIGDFGDNTNSSTGSVSSTSYNAAQQAIMASIAGSGARFVVGVGDLAYQDGTQANYGDLRETGTNAPGGTDRQRLQISNIFGPRYWAQINGVPFFPANGNHGRNNNIMRNWPMPATIAASGGTYDLVSYPAMDGASAATYGTVWYAFSTGNVRIYALDASWTDGNVGSGNGGLCKPTPCASYQLDRDQHWKTTSPEYQWLKADLLAHPGGLKLAMFHYPLRSDNSTQPSDPYLQNTASNPNSLEALLSANGVKLAFNGHAHIYQRNAPTGPGQIISYVTGGGGGKVEPVGTGVPCAATDAYAVGWTYSHNHGYACGAAPIPTSPLHVYHYLKVTVVGTSVTVTPVNALGQTFDARTYSF